MGLARRTKVGLDAEVKTHSIVLEPAATVRGKLDRLVDLGQPEHAAIERDCVGLAADRHGELHVVEPDDRHAISVVPGDARLSQRFPQAELFEERHHVGRRVDHGVERLEFGTGLVLSIEAIEDEGSKDPSVGRIGIGGDGTVE